MKHMYRGSKTEKRSGRKGRLQCNQHREGGMRCRPWYFRLSRIESLEPRRVLSATLRVGAGEPYASIQTAYNAANNGDTLLIDDGVYTQTSTFFVQKQLTFEAVHTGGATISGGGFAPDDAVFRLATDATFIGLHLDNALAGLYQRDSGAHGVAENLLITNCSIGIGINNSAGTEGSFDVLNCTIDGGSLGGNHAIDINDGGTINVTNTIMMNYADAYVLGQLDIAINPSHNLLYNVATPSYGHVSTDPEPLVADPLFANVAAGDYHLSPGSPAIDSGVDVGLPYSGSAPDRGAFESGTTPDDNGPPPPIADPGLAIVPSTMLFTDSSLMAPGLVGAYFNENLRGSTVTDWAKVYTASGIRVDPNIGFFQNNWGSRASVGITGGPSDDNWDYFSVQWDGYINIPDNGTYLYVTSDDGSRLWIDVNHDGVFANDASELVNGNWGNEAFTGYRPSSPSVALAAGVYPIRIQYEDGFGGNEMYLQMSNRPEVAGLAPAPSSMLSTTDSSQAAAGLVGTYINADLRGDTAQDDWRYTQTVGGTRIDQTVAFSGDSFGTRSTLGITGGTDNNWDNFSVQWDGYITIPADGIRLYTRSDDSSRMWIDVNGDGVFGNSSPEYVSNNWGNGQAVTVSPASVPLAKGTYRIRIQYEEGIGTDSIFLLMAAPTPVGVAAQPTGTVDVPVVNPSFENQTIADGSWIDGSISGWSQNGYFAGPQNWTDYQFLGATDGDSLLSSVPDGNNSAYSRGPMISQVLTTTLAPNTQYTLNVDVGHRRDGAFPGYDVQLWAGGSLLSEDDHGLWPAPGQFVTSTVTYVSGSNDPELGQPLEIRLLAPDDTDPTGYTQAVFDNVRLSSMPRGAVDTTVPSITISWLPVPNAGSYVVERATGAGGPFKQIAILPMQDTAYLDQGTHLLPDTSYFYRVRSLSGGISSPASPVVSATTLPLATRPFVVTTTHDSGPGSLRQAILDSNAQGGHVTISFDIPGDAPHVITPNAALPPITAPVVIDATTEPGYSGGPLIVLDGSRAGQAEGFTVSAPDSTVRGFDIQGFAWNGIWLNAAAGGDTITQNYIGTDATGTQPAPNGLDGIGIDNSPNNVIGGSSTNDRNIISGNGSNGIAIVGAASSNNQVAGNYIGVEVNGRGLGQAAAAWYKAENSTIDSVNGLNGTLQGGATFAPGEVGQAFKFAGGSDELLVSNSATGPLDITGTQITVEAWVYQTDPHQSDNPWDLQVIAGKWFDTANKGYLLQTAFGGYLTFGVVTTSGRVDVQAPTPLPLNTWIHVAGTYDGQTMRVFENGAQVASGAQTGAILHSSNNASIGNIFATDGWKGRIDEVTVYSRGLEATEIATIAAEGTAGKPNAMGNGGGGIEVNNSSGNLIGGSTVQARNVISGNAGNGVHLSGFGTAQNVIAGNFIGTDASGTMAVGNRYAGVFLDSYFSPGTETNNRIGTDGNGVNDAAERNVISGNGVSGIVFGGQGTSANVVAGNYVGTNANGTAALGNSQDGINFFLGPTGNVVGGSKTAQRNLLSGNAQNGVTLGGSSANLVQGNYIGTDATGSYSIPNFDGVVLSAGATNNSVGGSVTAAGNLISGNADNGVGLYDSGTTNNVIAGNLIGTDNHGDPNLGNGNGIGISYATGNIIGGIGQPNIIAGNTREGVVVVGSSTIQNSIRGNSIFSNSALGIDLGQDGVTANHQGNVAGPNNFQNYPVLSAAWAFGSALQVDGSLQSTPNTTFTIDFYSSSVADPSGHGQGQTYLGSISVTTNADGVADFSAPSLASAALGQAISATATDPNGNTSEFSADYAVGQSPWAAVTTTGAPPIVDTMLLLPDGSILAHALQKPGQASEMWYNLIPAPSGDYSAGTWKRVASMHVPREYFASNVLKDGHVLVLGGEYTNPDPHKPATETNTGEIYDPSRNTWTSITPFPLPHFGDGPTEILDDGEVLCGYNQGPQTFLYDPSLDPLLNRSLPANSNPWHEVGSLPTYGLDLLQGSLIQGSSSEVTWLKLTDGSILTYDVRASVDHYAFHAERYSPQTAQWVDVSPPNLNEFQLSSATLGYELGPAFLLNDGSALFIGANGNTAIYHTDGTWTTGPVLAGGLGADDAPGCVLPNGGVIIAADKPGEWESRPDDPPAAQPIALDYLGEPTAGASEHFLPLDLPTELNTKLQASGAAYLSRMLALPTGQVLISYSQNEMYLYTPSSPADLWRPTVTSWGEKGDSSTFILHGTQLNGRSEGASYGDDAEMATNYPIVELHNGASAYFARTDNWSTTGVATRSAGEDVDFTLPAGMPVGQYQLVAIGNGIPSEPQPFTVSRSPTVTCITSSSPLSTDGQPVTFTAKIDTGQSGVLPVGMVQFAVDGIPLGMPVCVANGQAVSTADALSGRDTAYIVTASFTNADGKCYDSADTLYQVAMPATVSGAAEALQRQWNSGGTISVGVTTDALLHVVSNAISSLLPSNGQNATVTLDLQPGIYSDLSFSVPAGVTLVVDGNGSTIVGQSPALEVSSGAVLVDNVMLATNTDSPTVLVDGGSVTLRDDVIQQLSGTARPAILVSSGTVDLGTADDSGDNTITVASPGEFVHNVASETVPAIGDSFVVDGTTLPATELSFTSLSGPTAAVPFAQTVNLVVSTVPDSADAGEPSGQVDFVDASTGFDLGTATIVNGVAALPTAALAVGVNKIIAEYKGDDTFLPSLDTMAVAVIADTTTVTIVSNSPNPGPFGQTVTFAGAVANNDASPVPSGTVTIYDDGRAVASGPVAADGTFSIGVAALAVGSHPNLTAAYTSDSPDFANSTTLAAAETIVPDSTKTSIATITPSPAQYAQTVVFSGLVSNLEANLVPIGSVTILDNGIAVASGPVAADGSFSIGVSTLALGPHPNITAQFTSSSDDFADSTSAPSSETIVPDGTSTLVVSSGNPAVFGEPVTFDATVTNTSGTGLIPTGSLQFVVDGMNFGTVVPLDASGHAKSAPISFWAVSSHTVMAEYVNSDGFFVSGNDTAIQTVQTTALEPDPITPGATDLFIGGTAADGHIEFDLKNGQIVVDLHDSSAPFQTPLSALNALVVYGQADNEHIQVDNHLLLPAFLFGGNGKNVHIEAGGGPTVEVAGSGGNAHLEGGPVRDLLIAGKGGAHLESHGGDDILIGGDTDFDTNLAALETIMAEWDSSDTYDARIAALAALLNTSTVHDNGVADHLQGNPGMDWFFANFNGSPKDKIDGAAVAEIKVEID